MDKKQQIITATYSPDDNKLRLYPAGRLDAETYARVKAAGFKWAPKQGLFVAPMWTPARADLLIELAGEIGDEDTSLCERAEERADRFEGYQENRQRDADSAHRAVKSIADNIPLGQPILIGHHSERHARRDAAKIENGMRRAVKMWETAQYWESRAAGAIANAKYKERPDVRARRIKVIEAYLRKQERYKSVAERNLQQWTREGLTLEQAQILAGFSRLNITRQNVDGTENGYAWTAYDVLRPDGGRYRLCPSKTVAECQDAARRAYPRVVADCDRWIEHYQNRLTYERAMLAEAGGTAADKFDFQIGGQVLSRGKWFVIVRVNAQSVSVRGHFATTITHDKIKDYKPPTAEQTAATAAAMKIPPLCNYPGEGFKHMTKAELDADKWRKWSDSPRIGWIKATETHGAHRVQQTRADGSQWHVVPIYITDQKRKDPPALKGPQPELPRRHDDELRTAVRADVKHPDERAAQFDAMRESLRAGVQVVTVPQLFPTPPELAARMVNWPPSIAGIEIIEPSGGTGNIIRAIQAAKKDVDLIAVEIKPRIAEIIRAALRVPTHCKDFLQCNGELGKFDRIIMNPPF